MSQLVTKIRTDEGDLQIDYNALANLPDTDNTLSKSGQAADAKSVGDKLAKKIDKDNVIIETGIEDNHAVLECVHFSGQGVTQNNYGVVVHNYTDSPLMRLDNVGSAPILNLVNAHNAVRRSDKDDEYHGSGDVLSYIVQNNPNGDQNYGQYQIFQIDEDGKLFWSGWNNSTAGDSNRNQTVKLQTNKLDGGTWAFNLDAIQHNQYLLLLSTGEKQIMQVLTNNDNKCVIDTPNGVEINGRKSLNLISDGNILIVSGSDDITNALRFYINGAYYYPQYTNKICTSTNRPTVATVGEIYLETDTNRTIRRNAANSGWVDMNGQTV